MDFDNFAAGFLGGIVAMLLFCLLLVISNGDKDVHQRLEQRIVVLETKMEMRRHR